MKQTDLALSKEGHKEILRVLILMITISFENYYRK